MLQTADGRLRHPQPEAAVRAGLHRRKAQGGAPDRLRLGDGRRDARPLPRADLDADPVRRRLRTAECVRPDQSIPPVQRGLQPGLRQVQAVRPGPEGPLQHDGVPLCAALQGGLQVHVQRCISARLPERAAEAVPRNALEPVQALQLPGSDPAEPAGAVRQRHEPERRVCHQGLLPHARLRRHHRVLAVRHQGIQDNHQRGNTPRTGSDGWYDHVLDHRGRWPHQILQKPPHLPCRPLPDHREARELYGPHALHQQEVRDAADQRRVHAAVVTDGAHRHIQLRAYPMPA